MSNYIINPRWFYWMHVLSSLKEMCTILAVIIGLIAVGLTIAFIVEYHDGVSYGKNDPDYKAAMIIKVPMIICSILAVLFLIGVIFIPSKETLIEMQIAKFTTYENAEWTIDKIKEAVDYVLKAIATAGK